MVREFVVPALPDGGQPAGGAGLLAGPGRPGPGAGPAGRRRRRRQGAGPGLPLGLPDASLLVEVRQPRRFTLSLYFVDWDRQGRRQTVTVEDAGGTRVWDLDRDFGDGLWASWEVSATPERPLRVSLRQTGPGHGGGLGRRVRRPGARAGSGPAPPGRSAPRGDWRGVYGADGYLLFAWRSFNVDVGALPAYAARYELSHVGDRPDPRIHVEIAEADVLDTPLLYALALQPAAGQRLAAAGRPGHRLTPGPPRPGAGRAQPAPVDVVRGRRAPAPAPGVRPGPGLLAHPALRQLRLARGAAGRDVGRPGGPAGD